MRKFITLVILALPAYASAQSLSGTVRDSISGEPLISASILLRSQVSDSLWTQSGLDGSFSFGDLAAGTYRLCISYVGYADHSSEIWIREGQESYADILMEPLRETLEAGTVRAHATRAVQKGDSLIYNADAFKVMDGSSVEDLLSKMPGIVVEGGSVQAQGEDVGKVLVDGKEFFDGDVSLALKNLPADIIQSIEVFDKKSEQAEFTGFDDGEQVKTINIVTRSGYRNGTFGKVSGGYGTDNRYNAGGNINFFSGDRRISVLGMSNNVNQQNFSQEDLAGVMSSGASSRGRRGGRKGGRSSGASSGGSSASDFMVGQIGGITATNGIGVNYVDKWGKSLSFTGSYFFNQSCNTNETDLQRHFFETEGLPVMSYNEWQDSQMENWNHRMNMKIDWQPDRNNSLQIRPQFSIQDNSSSASMSGESLSDAIRTALTQSSSENAATAYNAGGSLVYRHRFNRPGRTISLMVNGSYTGNGNDNLTDYLNWYPDKPQEEYSQSRTSTKSQYSIRGNLSYTETLAERLQLLASYKASYSDTDSDKRTYDQSPASDLYDQLDESLSNVFTSGYLTQSAGVGFRYSAGKFNVNFGGDFQYSSLNGRQTFPSADIIGKDFWAFLPNLTARYSVDRTNSFILRYRTSSSSPSVTELQNVIDNTNPLFVSTGNPALDQQTSHSGSLRYVHTSQNGHTFIAMLGATIRQDYAADSTFTAAADQEIAPGIILDRGAQFTKPVNMDGYYSFQGMLTYGFPLDFMRSNLNLSVSANYANVPAITDGVRISSRDLTLVPKAILGSNISRDLDFTLTYSAAWNRMFSSAGGNSGEYVNHAASFRFGWTFWQGFTLRSNLLYSGYSGLDEGYTDYWLWSASFGKKFLKDRSLEVSLEAYDILNQNMAFTHSTGSSWYDYISSTVLKRYFMLKLTWDIRM